MDDLDYRARPFVVMSIRTNYSIIYPPPPAELCAALCLYWYYKHALLQMERDVKSGYDNFTASSQGDTRILDHKRLAENSKIIKSEIILLNHDKG